MANLLLGLRNANHTQTLDLTDIYGRFVYEDNLIQRRYSDTKKALITTPSSTPISTAFFSNNVIQDFQENSDDEVDERSSEEYLRDLDVEYHKRAFLANLKHFIKRRNNFLGQKANENTKCYKCVNKGHFARDCFSKLSKPSYNSLVNNYSSVSKGFQPRFTLKLIQSSSNSNNQADSKFQKDYKAEYKNMKAKLALLKENPSKVSVEEEVTQVKVLMALADDELTVEESCSQMLNHALQEQLKEEKRINEKWLTSSKKVIQCISEQIPHQKKKVLGRELFIESSSKMNEIENLFVPASIGYDQEMVLKTKDWVERLNPDSKLPNFNESLEPTETLNTPESSKDSEAESLTPLPPLKNLEGALPSSEATPLTFQPHSPRERLGLGTMKHTNPETHDSSNKYVSKTVTGSKTKQTTPSVPTEVKRHIREPIWYLDSGCSRSMTGVKSYLHKYVEQPGPKTRRNDVMSLDMSSLTPNGACFFAKAKKVKGLHLLHMDLFGPVSLMFINHEKYTLVIVDEYSRYTWVHFLRKKSQAPEIFMSFMRMVENQNDVKVKQIRTDNRTEFRNQELESFCDKKGISQNFSSPYTPEQNGVAEMNNKTLIEAARTMLNGSDHLGKFNAKADDGYILGYSFISKAFRVFNTRRQKVEETYHVTFDESMEAIRFTNTLVDEIGIDDSSRYPPDEFLQEDDPSRQYQNDQIITQPTDIQSGNNIEVSGSITEFLVPDVIQSHISNQASTSSHPIPRDRWSRDEHIELVNIIGDPGEGMLTRSMAVKLTAASASECLFADFLSEIEPKKVSEALKHPGWIDAMQEELNQFYRNKVWTLVPLLYGKIAIGSKWVFKNKKDEHGITTKNKARLVAQGYSQEEGID
ncbi:retrovirus-related pol polyprotein from transposon TNT 1-94 [Tanacetum coccineum]